MPDFSSSRILAHALRMFLLHVWEHILEQQEHLADHEYYVHVVCAGLSQVGDDELLAMNLHCWAK